MRLHGFSLMSMVLSEYLADEEIVKTVRDCLDTLFPYVESDSFIRSRIADEHCTSRPAFP